MHPTMQTLAFKSIRVHYAKSIINCSNNIIYNFMPIMQNPLHVLYISDYVEQVLYIAVAV